MNYIENCLDSLFRGSRIPAVIVVDNGSSDGSCELVRDKYPQVKLITLRENTGFCHAVNVGIEETETEFVFLLNNDTAVEENCVEELEKVMENSHSFFSAGAKMINMKFPEKIDDAGDFYCALGWAFARGKDKPAANYQKGGRIFAACGGAALYRTSLLREAGMFDEEHFAYLEDIDIGYRANIMGYRNVFAPEAVVYHAGSGVSGSRHNAFKVDLSSRNSIYLVYKNMPFLQILINLPFLLAGFLVKYLFFIKKGMGAVYAKGILKGVKLSFSEKGRKKKVAFKIRRLPYYLWIQWELWFSILRRVLLF
ncbi:MAG: glycosyltransferase family 2 protein [Lachnospiraceae bacterium]|nr:glycosyltransferase family 2 protein [Lachnospiraceae bacterium]